MVYKAISSQSNNNISSGDQQQQFNSIYRYKVNPMTSKQQHNYHNYPYHWQHIHYRQQGCYPIPYNDNNVQVQQCNLLAKHSNNSESKDQNNAEPKDSEHNVTFSSDNYPLTDDKLTNIIEPKLNEHQLQHSWTFWYLRFQKNFSWEHSQIDVATFSTVESFWGVFDGLLPLTETHHGCNYSIFKKGIRPIWEDPMNRNGGRFVFSINKEMANYKSYSDSMWLEFCMLLIGNSVPEICEQICGIVGGNRSNLIKIAVWTRESQSKQNILKIGDFLKKLSRYEQFVPYEVHMDLFGNAVDNGTGRIQCLK